MSERDDFARGLALAAFILSIISTYLQFFYENNDLKVHINGDFDIEHTNELSKMTVVFLNYGTEDEAVVGVRYVFSKCNQFGSISSKINPIESFILKSGEKKVYVVQGHLSMESNFKSLSSQTCEYKNKSPNSIELAIQFELINANAKRVCALSKPIIITKTKEGSLQYAIPGEHTIDLMGSSLNSNSCFN